MLHGRSLQYTAGEAVKKEPAAVTSFRTGKDVFRLLTQLTALACGFLKNSTRTLNKDLDSYS